MKKAPSHDQEGAFLFDGDEVNEQVLPIGFGLLLLAFF